MRVSLRRCRHREVLGVRPVCARRPHGSTGSPVLAPTVPTETVLPRPRRYRDATRCCMYSTWYGFRVEYAAGNTSDAADTSPTERQDVRSAIDASCVLSSTNGVQWQAPSGPILRARSGPVPLAGCPTGRERPNATTILLKLAKVCQPRYQDSMRPRLSRGPRISSCHRAASRSDEPLAMRNSITVIERH